MKTPYGGVENVPPSRRVEGDFGRIEGNLLYGDSWELGKRGQWNKKNQKEGRPAWIADAAKPPIKGITKKDTVKPTKQANK